MSLFRPGGVAVAALAALASGCLTDRAGGGGASTDAGDAGALGDAGDADRLDGDVSDGGVFDASLDASLDAIADGPLDAGADVARDVAADTSADVASDGAADAAVDATADASLDATADALDDDAGDDGATDAGAGDDTGDDGATDAGAGDDAGDDGATDAGAGDDAGDDGATDAGAGDDAGDDGATDAGAGDDAGDDGATDAGDDAGTPPAPGDHALFSELSTQHGAREFLELWNPTGSAIDLSDHYLSDNSIYYAIADGAAWAPDATPGTDFLVQFPPGSVLEAGEVAVVALHRDFHLEFGGCPDYYVLAAQSGGTTSCGSTSGIPVMVIPANGSAGVDAEEGSRLTNSREMVVLFTWSGLVGEDIRDVDYLTWGSAWETATRVDKSGVGSYLDDTPRGSQLYAAAPASGQSLERCSLEPSETLSGGNGLTGHDETSENLGAAFVVRAVPSPGVAPGCL